MEGQLREIIHRKIIDALAEPTPKLTRRDTHLPAVPDKALAVIGMRRSGKTCFLWQILEDRVRRGEPREAQLYFNFEDERLASLTAADLHGVVEEYFSIHPQYRRARKVALFFDEIQVVAGWETFARRMLDTESVDLYLSGSSARLLSREVATSMRGRAMEALVHPFSFRETLRHRGEEPDRPWADLASPARSAIDNRFRAYLAEGGFPEAQGLSTRDRVALLRSYVDVTILRDVIERHGVTNTPALRWLVRHLMGNPASTFSVQKFYDALRSQGIPVGKNTLHEYLGYLEDAFLVRAVTLHTASERQRMVNPRKAFPIDAGLIPVFERTGRPNLGRALETAVLLELDRRGCEYGYWRTTEGYEVDFVARDSEGGLQLLQVTADATDPATFDREVRALARAAGAFPAALPLLLTGEFQPPPWPLPESIRWMPAGVWLLDGATPAHHP